MKKLERGSYDYRFDRNNKILCVKWNDNVGSVLTNYDFVESLHVKCCRKKIYRNEYPLLVTIQAWMV